MDKTKNYYAIKIFLFIIFIAIAIFLVFVIVYLKNLNYYLKNSFNPQTVSLRPKIAKKIETYKADKEADDDDIYIPIEELLENSDENIVNLLDPAPKSQVTIGREDFLNVQWQIKDSSYKEKSVPLYLVSKKHRKQEPLNFKNLSAQVFLDLPPGEYTLQLGSNSKNRATVKILGKQIASSAFSEFEFLETSCRDAKFCVSTSSETGSTYGTSSQIINDGNCTTEVYVSLYDKYDYPLVDRKIRLTSSRGSSDTVQPESKKTDNDGSLIFQISSTKIGFSKIYLEIDNERWPDFLELEVLDKNKNDCLVKIDNEEE